MLKQSNLYAAERRFRVLGGIPTAPVAGLLAIQLLASPVLTPKTWAQENRGQEAQEALKDGFWESSKEAAPEGRFKAVWSRQYTTAPLTVNKSEVVARAREQIIANGGTPEQANDYAKSTGENLEAIKNGYSQTDILSLVRDGSKIKVNISASPKDAQKRPADAQKTSYIDFFDGINAISIVKSDKLITGDLSRREERVLDRSFNKDIDKLVFHGQPLSSLFSRKDARIEKIGEDVRISQLKTPGDMSYQDVLTADSKTKLPSSFVRINTLNNKPVYKYTFSQWKKVSESFWLPEKVTFDGAAQVEYTLLKAEQGSTVDPSELKLPPRIDFMDARFGPDQAVAYIVRDGEIPSDAQVKKLLGEKKQNVAAKGAEQTANQTPLVMLAGLCLLCTGGLLWKRSS